MHKRYRYIGYILLLVIIILVATLYNTIHSKNINENFQDSLSQPIDLESTQIYVINLEKNKERLNNFNKYYQNTDLQSQKVERIHAIYGLDIPYKDYIVENPEDKSLTPGMVGCYLSHIQTYQTFLDSGKPYAIIFEDDAKITNAEIYKTTISQLHTKIPDDWDIILLGYFNHDPIHRFDDAGDYYKFWNFFGTHSYIINRRSAQKMIDLMQAPITNQIDNVMGSLARKSKLQIYGIKKVEVVQDTPYTDVQTRKGT